MGPEAAAEGFFAFSPENVEREVPLVSAFLASAPAHRITSTWLQRVVHHWLFRKPPHRRPDLGYYWLHVLFGQMVGDPIVGKLSKGNVSEEARRIWASVPRVSGAWGEVGPNFWVMYDQKLKPP